MDFCSLLSNNIDEGVKFLELVLKKEAVIQEIKICEEIIEQEEKKLEEIGQDLSQITDRLAVLNALNDKLTGSVKMLNAEDIKDLSDQRKDLLPKVKRYQNRISNMQANIKALNELLNE